jgi:ArsR family transcriptional regulator
MDPVLGVKLKKTDDDHVFDKVLTTRSRGREARPGGDVRRAVRGEGGRCGAGAASGAGGATIAYAQGQPVRQDPTWYGPRMAAAKRARLTDKQVARIAKALSDPRRYLILQQIGEQDCLPCSAITEQHDVSAPTISHHLKELGDAELIEVTREGKNAILRINRAVLRAYAAALAKI